jgi:hypothetical protein
MSESADMPLFDGYCPECRGSGRQMPLQHNNDGLLECPACRLQLVLAPPLAGILRWRGQGRLLTEGKDDAPLPASLPLAACGREEGTETQPDATDILSDHLSLEWYLHQVCNSYADFEAHQFHAKDPVFDQQRKRLAAITPDQWQLIFESFRQFSQCGIRFNIRKAPGFRVFEQYLRQYGVLFDFRWQAWHAGWNQIRNIRFPYSRSSLLDLSMYLSAIFLSEPYDEGTVEFYFNNKTLERIMQAMEAKVPAEA